MWLLLRLDCAFEVRRCERKPNHLRSERIYPTHLDFSKQTGDIWGLFTEVGVVKHVKQMQNKWTTDRNYIILFLLGGGEFKWEWQHFKIDEWFCGGSWGLISAVWLNLQSPGASLRLLPVKLPLCRSNNLASSRWQSWGIIWTGLLFEALTQSVKKKKKKKKKSGLNQERIIQSPWSRSEMPQGWLHFPVDAYEHH